MRNSDVSAHSDSEIPPLRRWFQDTYSREYLSHPQQSSFEYASMSFHSPYKSPGHSNVDYSATPRRRFRTTSLSPRYLSPIANGSRMAFEEEYVMGCSVCGTKAIEEASWTYHDSPPRMRPSNKPELVDMDQENSGAYSAIISCRLHKAYSWLADAVSMKEIELLEGKLDPEANPFAVQSEVTPTSGPVAQTTVLKEVFPSPAVPLTPLNYEDANMLKESVFHNPLAEKYVREEERLRVVTRRAEYANRVKGFTRVVENTKMKGESIKEEHAEEADIESMPVAAVPMDLKEQSTPGHEEPGEDRKNVRVKAPSSFRTQQRHSTAQIKTEREVAPRSPAAESEEMTESTGRPANAELARRKLEEIKMTVKQRREERKNKEMAQPAGKGAFGGREGQRQLTSGSQRSAREGERRNSKKDLPTKANSNPDLLSGQAFKSAAKPARAANPEERKSAVIGASRFRHEESEPRSSSSSAQDLISPFVRAQDASSEEEAIPQPTMTAPEEPPALEGEEPQGQESISPIPVDSSALEPPAEENKQEEPLPADYAPDAQEPEEQGTEEVKQETEGVKQETEERKQDAGKKATPRASRSKPETPKVTSPRPQFESSRSKPPTPSMANMQLSAFPGRRQPAEEVKGEDRKGETPRGRKSASNSPKPQQGTSQKGKSATGTPQRSPKTSPRPASERGQGFIGKMGPEVHVGESQLGESRRSSERQPVPEKAKPVQKSLPKQQRKKLASAKVAEVSNFYKLQDEAATIIQHAARRYLNRVSRNKTTQMDTEGYLRVKVRTMQEVMDLLDDEDVLAGLRLLGGFVEYLEARGLKDL